MGHRSYLKHIDQNIQQPDLSSHQRAVFILHDQLNLNAWPEWVREEKPLLIFIESFQKGNSIPYHKKKLVYVLSSMRHFALECSDQGFPVAYHSSKNHYDEALIEILSDNCELKLLFMTPSERDSRQRLRKVKDEFSGRVKEIRNNFFIAPAEEYIDKIGPGYRMEYFYRDMRRQTGYLMDGSEPEGGEWNYDGQNREKLPKNHPVPEITFHETDAVTHEVMELVEATFPGHFGETGGFKYAVTRRGALKALDEFIEERLDEFGPYEDAMAQGKHYLFHSHLSLYMNNGLLLPKEVCDVAQKSYDEGTARLNSVEGFIRQIIGWREFVRVYYEAMMPDVRDANHFGFEKGLPDLYWTGKTKMNCMAQCLKPVLEEGYSHHIPRLMVLSNFSNLTETNPRKLNEWFWLAYVDAYEWVVLPNVLGMSTFADGGVLASKPYVSSGNYINKMSDYCRHCEYSVSKKTGEDACPFNYLYWNFVNEQRETFTENGRANFMVNMFDKKDEEEKEAIRESSIRFINKLGRI